MEGKFSECIESDKLLKYKLEYKLGRENLEIHQMLIFMKLL